MYPSSKCNNYCASWFNLWSFYTLPKKAIVLRNSGLLKCVDVHCSTLQ